MPPSSPLLTLSYAAPAGAALPIRLQMADATLAQPSDSQNTIGDATSEASNLASQTAPFLEMEDEVEEPKGENDTSQSQSESFGETSLEKDNNLLLPVASAADCSQEEKKEEECPDLAARFSSSGSLAQQRVIGVSCGKRPRNSRRVSFASDAHWPTTNTNKTTLIRICETIHLNEYTMDERFATWYTLADLRSFKRERKETARQIDNGVLPLRQSVDQAGHNDIYVDTTSFSIPVEYCSRGAENCTEAMSRIRYRHICDGWRTVLNTQEKHRYQRRKLSSMTSRERIEYNALASLLGITNKASRRFAEKTSPRSSPKSDSDMCCPYDLAAAYMPASEASLEIARNRAIGDECDAMALREEDAKAANAASAMAASPVDESVNSTILAKAVCHDDKSNCHAEKNVEARTRTIDL